MKRTRIVSAIVTASSSRWSDLSRDSVSREVPFLKILFAISVLNLFGRNVQLPSCIIKRVDKSMYR